MKVLLLERGQSSLKAFLEMSGDKVVQTDGKVTGRYVQEQGIEFIVSYNYRYILPSETLVAVHGRAVNLHISLLPWNRGADPNFWSFVDRTPKGVTIHYMAPEVDAGDIIYQTEVRFGLEETLATTYRKLHETLQTLFMTRWQEIRDGRCPRSPQPAGGTVHRSRDKDPLLFLLTQGWDTPVSVLEAYGRNEQCGPIKTA